MAARWEYSFRSSDFNGTDGRDGQRRAKPGRRPLNDLDVPLSGEGQHPCPRGLWCASSTRDAEGTWHPLLINSSFCPADESAIVNAIPGLPESYARLAEQMTDSLRSKGSGPGGRRPPGSRVLLNAGDDALLREAASVLNAWAARVRSVPGISHSPRQHLPHTQAGVEENCAVLANWATQLLALPPGPVLRTWEYAPGRPPGRPAAPSLQAMGAARADSLGLGGPRPRRPGPAVPAVPCRRCGLFVAPSPSGKYWWPAVCTHAVVMPSAWAEGKNGDRFPVAWSCAECSTPFRGSPPRQRAACAHEPTAAPPARSGGIPADVEAEIEGLEVVRAGDGWVTCLTELSGIAAGLDVLDLAAKFKRRLGENPAPVEWLDGIQCRNRDCDAYALFRAPLPAATEEQGKSPFSECAECRDRMTVKEYREWTGLNGAFNWHAADVTGCRRCARGDHGECLWAACECPDGPHPKRRAALLRGGRPLGGHAEYVVEVTADPLRHEVVGPGACCPRPGRAVAHDLSRAQHGEVPGHVVDREAERGDELQAERHAVTGDRVPAGLGGAHPVLRVDRDDLAGPGRDQVGEVGEPRPRVPQGLTGQLGKDALAPGRDLPAAVFEFAADALLVLLADAEAGAER